MKNKVTYLNTKALPNRLASGQYILIIEHNVELKHTFVVAQDAGVSLFILYLGEVLGQVEINTICEARASIDVHELGIFTHGADIVLDKSYEAGQGSFGNYTVHHIVQGKAAVHDSSRVFIPQNAQLSEHYLSMKAYLHHMDAQARITPGLDVIANDVKAGHSGTIERFSMEEKYYMASRGINSEQAEQLLLEGLVLDYSNKIMDEQARGDIHAQLLHLIELR